jgi:hypothetical protein
MHRTASLLSHRNVPTTDDIMRHPWRVLTEKSEPNTITGNALLFSDFLESTSTWNQHHIIAFHMLDFNDVPINCLYPQAFYPLVDDPVIVEVDKLFNLSNEDIWRGKLNLVQTGPSFLFYRSLQDCIRTQQKTHSTQSPTRPRQYSQSRDPFHQYTMSDNSGSSSFPSTSSVNAITSNAISEDKTEPITNFVLISYLYLLAELENAAKEEVGGRSVLFRYIGLPLHLI